MMRVAVGDDVLQVELEVKQQLSAPLPADTVVYEANLLLNRSAVAAAGDLMEDVDDLVTAVRAMGRVTATGAGRRLVDR